MTRRPVRSPPKRPPRGTIAFELEPGKVLFIHPLTPRPEDGEPRSDSTDLAGVELTPSEREVATLILEGRDNPTIAALRGTSARTIANQVASIFAKLGVRSRAELAAKVYGAAPVEKSADAAPTRSRRRPPARRRSTRIRK